MKKLALLLAAMTLAAVYTFAQIGINTDGSLPDNSAMLDVKASDRGLLIPRMTTASRDQIPSPATGLLIYNTTTNHFNYFNSTYWFQSEAVFISSATGSLSVPGGVSISASPNTVAGNSSMLDIDNPSRGILIPRITPESIPAPVAGLIIYNIATNMLNYYNGTLWITLCAVSTGIPGSGGSQSPAGIAIDGSAPHHSAVLDVPANNKGILIPRLTTTQRSAILPVTGLVIYNSSVNAIEYYDGTGWYQLTSCTFICGSALTVNHVAGLVAPVTKSVTYGTVSNVPGETSKCWINSNLGADHQAVSVNDATEESAGWYWQFNKKQGYKHDGTTRTPSTTWITSINESS